MSIGFGSHDGWITLNSFAQDVDSKRTN